jgi:hypothetical protein
MEAVRISETSVYYNETTRRYIPKGSLLQEYSDVNLVSYLCHQSINYNYILQRIS